MVVPKILGSRPGCCLCRVCIFSENITYTVSQISYRHNSRFCLCICTELPRGKGAYCLRLACHPYCGCARIVVDFTNWHCYATRADANPSISCSMSVNAEPDAPLATSEWICKVCGHDCKTKSALGNHMNGFHTLPNPMLVEGNWVSVKRNAQELLECPFTDCPNRHASRRVFQKHLTDAHSVDIRMFFIFCRS